MATIGYDASHGMGSMHLHPDRPSSRRSHSGSQAGSDFNAQLLWADLVNQIDQARARLMELQRTIGQQARHFAQPPAGDLNARMDRLAADMAAIRRQLGDAGSRRDGSDLLDAGGWNKNMSRGLQNGMWAAAGALFGSSALSWLPFFLFF